MLRSFINWHLSYLVVEKIQRSGVAPLSIFSLNRGIELGLLGSSGGASAVREPGHFEVRKSSSQVTPYCPFSLPALL
jgi:hypothetical protein